MISRLLEDNPDCRLVPYDKTVAVTAFPTNGEFFPHADRCVDEAWQRPPQRWDSDPYWLRNSVPPGINLYCTYEEELFVPAAQPRWFEQPVGTTLFHLFHEPMDYASFSGDPTGATSDWGRTGALANFAGTDSVIDVKVVAGDREYLPSFIPRSVNWTLQYYQVDQGSKRLVTSFIAFGNYCTITTAPDLQVAYVAMGVPLCQQGDNFVSTPVTSNYQYSLTFKFEALGWLDLLNRFQFPATIYLVIDTFFGLMVLMLGFLTWYVHRANTRMKNPPVFHFSELAAIVSPAPLLGGLLVAGPVLVVTQAILVWFIYNPSKDPINSPNLYQFEKTSGSWNVAGTVTTDQVILFRTGRVGNCLCEGGEKRARERARTRCVLTRRPLSAPPSPTPSSPPAPQSSAACTFCSSPPSSSSPTTRAASTRGRTTRRATPLPMHWPAMRARTAAAALRRLCRREAPLLQAEQQRSQASPRSQ
jgi:hypothetical protein